jgi:hypothetical protein
MATTDHNPEVAHEQSDVNVRAILWFSAGLIVVAVVIHVAIWGLFELFETRTAAADPRPAPLAAPAGQLPPTPRLQTRPVNDLKAMRALEDALLNAEQELPDGRIPIDMPPSRIPIERAKQLLVERGLPVRPH